MITRQRLPRRPRRCRAVRPTSLAEAAFSRSTWSASSASRARAPSTTAAGAFDVNASFASRARAASRNRSASASSFSSRARSASARRRSVGEHDERLEVARRRRPATRSRHRRRGTRDRRRPPAVGRGRAARRPGAATRTPRQRGGHGEPHRQPRWPAPPAASARALRTARTSSTSARPRPPRPRLAAPPTGQRATISSSGSSAGVRQRAPELLGHERHDRVEQPQVRVQRLDERPPRRLARLVGQRLVGEADLRELEAPVAELGPDAVVQRPRDLAEVVVGDRPGRRRRSSPPPATGSSARPVRARRVR